MSQSENLFKFVAPMVVTGALLVSSGAAFGQQKTVPDAQVEANVLKALAGAPQLANQSIQSTTVYGVVTLSGTVPDENTRVLAETLASRAEGVQKVVDELTLGTADPNGQSAPAAIGVPPPPADGAQPSAAHAPDPDVYAQTHPNAGQPDDSQANSAPQSQPAGRQPMYGTQPPAYAPAPGPAPYGAQQAGIPVTIQPGSMLRVSINQGLDGKYTKVGTNFTAIVLNDVVAGGQVAIPRGATVQGTVVEAKAAGAFKGRGEISVQLNSVVLAGKVFPLVTNTWSSDGPDKTGRTVGNTVGLGILGAIIGGAAGGGGGAAVGAVAGGAAGLGTSAASGGGQAIVPPEAIISFSLDQPAQVTTVSQAEMDRLGYSAPRQRVVRRNPYAQPYYGPGYPYPY